MNILDKPDIFTEKRRQLLGALIGLARACGNAGISDETTKVLMNALISLHPMSGESEDELSIMINKVHARLNEISPGCAACQSKCGNTDDYSFDSLLSEPVKIQELKEKVLLTLLEVPVSNAQIFYRALSALGAGSDMDTLSEIYSALQ